jgi:hypothetical protein
VILTFVGRTENTKAEMNAKFNSDVFIKGILEVGDRQGKGDRVFPTKILTIGHSQGRKSSPDLLLQIHEWILRRPDSSQRIM